MHKAMICSAIYLMILFPAAAGEESMLTSADYRNRFIEIRDSLGMKGEMESMWRRALKTDYSTPIRPGIEMESDDLKLMIDPDSGQILSLQADHEYPQDNAPEMSLDKAEETIASLMKKMGVTLRQDMKEIYKGYNVETDQWGITWGKQIAGYPFPEATTFITIGDKDGKVVFYRDRTTEHGRPFQPKVDKVEARGTAELRMRFCLPLMYGHFYDIASITQGELKYVYPNGHFANDNPENALPLPLEVIPRLVYSYGFSFKYIGTNAHSKAIYPIQIWVDAVTGLTVGGL